jgi:hypothetical protein
MTCPAETESDDGSERLTDQPFAGTAAQKEDEGEKKNPFRMKG